MLNFKVVTDKLADLLAKKNEAYGDSFKDSASFLKLLFPNGIKSESYFDILALIRIFDKMKRIATANDPSGENPWQDIAGYAVLQCAQIDLPPQATKQYVPGKLLKKIKEAEEKLKGETK